MGYVKIKEDKTADEVGRKASRQNSSAKGFDLHFDLLEV